VSRGNLRKAARRDKRKMTGATIKEKEGGGGVKKGKPGLLSEWHRWLARGAKVKK